MTRDADETGADPIRTAAYAWIVQMHGPDAASSTDAFDAWLAEDAAHRDAYREVTAQWERAKFLTHTKTGQARNLASVAIWYRRPVARQAAVAVLALCVVAAGLLLVRLQHHPTTSPMIAYATKTGEIRTVQLSDGTSVILDAASSIKVSIDATKREVRLIDGVARFDVTPDPNRPFAVVTAGGTVTASNALFDMVASHGLIRVTALRGALSYQASPAQVGLGSAASVAINPGQRLSLAESRADLTSAPQAGSQDWTTGMLSFDGERLADAIVEVNRHNARKIVLTDASLADLRITGAFHADDARGFARTIAAMLGLSLQDRDGGAIELGPKK